MKDSKKSFAFAAMVAVSISIMDRPALASSKYEAATSALDAAIQSLKAQPNQFNVQISCQGLQAISNGGAPAINNNVVGGGLGSQTTGITVTTSSAQCQVATGNATAAVQEQGEQAVKLLTELKSALEAKKVDNESIIGMLADLGQTYISPALKKVIETVVKKVLRLP